MEKKKYALVGTGYRGRYAYLRPLYKEYADVADLCGVYDLSKKRAETALRITGIENVPVFDSFEEMLETAKPEVVIVTSMDSTHDEYIVKALRAGCDVISEKPLTTTPEKFMAIWQAEKETGKRVTTTFNCRYMNQFEEVKKTVQSGILGDILSVHYEWMLDRDHGASYFRRWHRERKNSGSLLIHKSTHHFDLLNWFLEDEPESVNAFGSRRVYGDTARKKGERCRDCPAKEECEYYFDLSKDSTMRQLYLECEDPKTGWYIADKCVFSEEIDIEDTVSVSIRYKKGTVVSYSLTAHSPYEGLRLVLNGTKGRAEFRSATGKGLYAGAASNQLDIFLPGEEVQTIVIPPKSGSHGGSDAEMLRVILRGEEEDPLGRAADTRAGGMSAGIGMAANLSMAENRRVEIREILDI